MIKTTLDEVFTSFFFFLLFFQCIFCFNDSIQNNREIESFWLISNLWKGKKSIVKINFLCKTEIFFLSYGWNFSRKILTYQYLQSYFLTKIFLKKKKKFLRKRILQKNSLFFRDSFKKWSENFHSFIKYEHEYGRCSFLRNFNLFWYWLLILIFCDVYIHSSRK